MGSGLSQKYNYTYGSINRENTASEVREHRAEYNVTPRILRESTGSSNINDNVSKMSGKFAPNEYGNFGRSGENTRIIGCDDPISESETSIARLGAVVR